MVNKMKTALLLGLLTGIILFIGSLWGERGLIMAFVLSVLMNFASYFFSDRIALAMYGARPVTREEAPRLYAIVEYLCSRAALPMPKLYIIPSDSPNAFATGRNPQHASVAVTEGALRLLDEEEMRGVLAHEISHVRNRDILTSSVAATLAGAIMMIARMAFFFGGSRDREEGGGAGGILMIILAPFAALFIQMWISRTREYEADRSGAEILGDPRGLASALQKLDAYSKRLPMQEAAPATAHLFIVHPFSGSSFLNMFSTHPPLEKRIERLLRKPH
jgi:heat shock protein HtpX